MPAAVYVLFGAGFTVSVCVAAGRLLIDRLRLPLDRRERWLFGFLLGGVLVSNLTFLLCAVHLVHKGVFLATGAGILLFAAWRRHECKPGPDAGVDRLWLWLLAGIGGAYFVLYLFNAWAPEISPDGSSYHLGLVARYMREHGFHRITTNMYANLSQGLEMLFLFAFAYGRHSGAAMVHFAYLAALPLAMVLFGRRSGMPAVGVCAALFVFASPMVAIDGISAYNDVAVACVAFGLFYLLQIWDAERTSGLLVAIGLLAGFAYAVKYTALPAVPYAVGYVGWKCIRGRKPWLRPVLTVALGALAVMLPWLAKNWIWVRNPFSPFLNALFPNPYIHVGFEQEYSRYFRHYEDLVHGYRDMPWALAVDGRLAGFLGPLFLLAPVGLLAVRWRPGRRLLLAAAVFGATWFLNVGTRFLIPALPFVALAMAMVLVRSKPLAVALVAAHAVFSWPGMTSLYCGPSAWRLREIPVRAALRIEPEDSFLDSHLGTYRMARLIERTTPRGATVFAASQVAEAYTTRNILVKDQAASNQVLGDILWTPVEASFVPARRLEFHFPAAAARRIRVTQTVGPAADQWSISELRVFRGETELARAAEWQIDAQPNPWEVLLAFDRAPVTRWRTWVPVRGGEFVQVDFGRMETIDRVSIECTRDQYHVKVKLEAAGAGGGWKTLAATAEASEGPPDGRLRRMASAEMKRRGVDYVMLYHDDFGNRDLSARAEEWGIVPVGVQGDDRLYRIE